MRNNEDQQQLLARIDYLEKINAQCVQALEMLASMGELHADAATGRDLNSIFDLAYRYLDRVTELGPSAFFVVDEETGLFNPHTCRPNALQDQLVSVVDELVNSGEFAWAINQNRPVELHTSDGRAVLLHVLATRSRIRGMFVALLKTDVSLPGSFFQHMISIIIHHISYAVESSHLYNLVSEHRDDLAEQTRELNLANAKLLKEIERRRFIESTLRENEERLRLSQQIANIATWEWNIESDNMFWSARAAELFGYPASVSETNSERFYRNILDDDRQGVRDAIDHAIHNRTECNTEFRIRTSSGDVHWLHIMASPFESKDEQACLFGVVQDITARQSAQIELLSEKDATRSEAELADCRIVYVEDDKVNITLLEKILSRWPQVTLYTATNADQGFDLIRKHRPDAVIMDIMMPGIDGFEALKRLREIPGAGDTPVIALSANAAPESIQRGLDAGFRYYLTKPIDVAVLYSTLVDVTRSCSD